MEYMHWWEDPEEVARRNEYNRKFGIPLIEEPKTREQKIEAKRKADANVPTSDTDMYFDSIRRNYDAG